MVSRIDQLVGPFAGGVGDDLTEQRLVGLDRRDRGVLEHREAVRGRDVQDVQVRQCQTALLLELDLQEQVGGQGRLHREGLALKLADVLDVSAHHHAVPAEGDVHRADDDALGLLGARRLWYSPMVRELQLSCPASIASV